MPRKPERKEPTVTIQNRVPESLYLWLKDKAQEGDRSLNAQISRLLTRAMQQETGQRPSGEERQPA